MTPTPAYIAGFFDGEGCISLFYMHRRPWKTDPTKIVRGFRLTILIANTHLQILKQLANNFGGHLYVNKATRQPQWKPVHSLRLQSAEEQEYFLRTIQPHAIVKREQVDIALRYLQTAVLPGKRIPQSAWQTRLDCYERLKEINRRGNGQGHQIAIPSVASTASAAAVAAWANRLKASQ